MSGILCDRTQLLPISKLLRSNPHFASDERNKHCVSQKGGIRLTNLQLLCVKTSCCLALLPPWCQPGLTKETAWPAPPSSNVFISRCCKMTAVYETSAQTQSNSPDFSVLMIKSLPSIMLEMIPDFVMGIRRQPLLCCVKPKEWIWISHWVHMNLKGFI